MNCSACGARTSIEDASCHACGADQRSRRLPVKRAAPPLPAVWRQAAPAVARGAALIAAGVIGEWLLRSAAKKAVSAPFGGGKGRKGKSLARSKDGALPEGVLAISETVIRRRVVIRR